jgi:protein involved in temperature-dependent protein secretion
MDPADVHVLWASIRPWGSDAHRARARADLDAAIRLDPRKASARIWMAQLSEVEGEIDAAESHLNNALAAAPGDPSATYALFRLLVRQASQGQGEGRWSRTDALLPKVLAIATSSRVQNGAARYFAIRQRADEGLPLALRAVRGDPSCWQCFDTLALLLAQKGAFEKAKEAQSVAVSLIPEGFQGSSLLASLRRYEEAARKKSAGSAPPCDPGSDCPEKAAAPSDPASAPPPAQPGGEFDRGAATKVLGQASNAAKQCKQPGGPTGSGRVKVVFQQSGSVSTAEVGPPFTGTPTGDCIARAFLNIRIPPFTDSAPVSVSKTVSIQ